MKAEDPTNWNQAGGALSPSSFKSLISRPQPATAGRARGRILKSALIGSVLALSAQFSPTVLAQTNSIQVKGYSDIILFDKPVAFFGFEEGSGPVASNSVPGGMDGAYYTGDEATAGAGGTPSSANTDPGPRPPAFKGFPTNNLSASFGGAATQDWVDTKKQYLQHLGAFSLEYWVRPTNRVTDPTTFGTRIGIVGQNDAVEYGFIDQNTIQIWTPNGGAISTAYSFPDGEWHHVATIADGSSIKTYYDGALITTGGSATTDYGSSTYNVHIGGGGVFDAAGNYFSGNIDEVAIFDRAIPAARIAQHYKAGKDGAFSVPFINDPLGNVTGFTIGITDVASVTPDTNTLVLKFNGAQVTPTSVTKTNGVTTVAYTVSGQPLASGSTNTTSLTVKDTSGVQYASDGTFVVPFYTTVPALAKVTADTTKPGFLWEMSQVESVGSYPQNSIERTIAQLAGLLGPNVADPNAQGIASNVGTNNADPNLPIEFEIPTVINLGINGNTETNGNFGPDDQMPGSPGTLGTTDNQAAAAVTYVQLPAGFVTLGVNSDDDFRTGIGAWNDAFNQQVLGEFNSTGGRGFADTVFKIYVQEAGVYPLFTLWENGGGGSNIEIFSVNPDGTKVLLNATTNGALKCYRALAGTPVAKAGARVLSPAPNATGVAPNAPVQVVLGDGATPIDKATVTLKLDAAVVPASISKTGSVTTVTFSPTNLLASASTHKLTLAYTEAGSAVTHDWQFTVAPYTKDKLHQYVGLVAGAAKFTPDGGGRSGKAGDFGIDLTSQSGWVNIVDGSFLNAATTNDELSFAMWIKKYDIAAGSAFWAVANSVSGGRGFQAHVPWSDDTIYFDTAGCCDATAQRINANINTFPDYTAVGSDAYWTNWHHFVFTKKADQKNIYIDGKLFLNGSSSDPLPTDFSQIGLGTDGAPGGDFMHGVIDDFAAFGKEVSAADAAQLAGGKLPTALTADNLLAYWDFNDATAVQPGGPTLTWARTATGFTITYTGTLQSVTNIPGTWQDVAGAMSPYTVTPSGAQAYFRSKQ